jgi:hypothetical protein
MHRLAQYRTWLKPAGRVMWVVAATFAPMVIATWAHTETDRVARLQRSGLALQLFGFIAVWKQLRDAIEEHGRPSWRSRIKSWWKNRPKGRDHVVHLSGTSSVAFAASATARVRRGIGDGSAEARLDAIEYNVGELQSEFDGFRRDIQQDTRALRTQLDAETRARSNDTGALAKRIEEQAVGSADLQLTGLVWFVFGSIYSTVPDLVVWLL